MNPAKRDSFPDEEDGYEQEENEDNQLIEDDSSHIRGLRDIMRQNKRHSAVQSRISTILDMGKACSCSFSLIEPRGVHNLCDDVIDSCFSYMRQSQNISYENPQAVQ